MAGTLCAGTALADPPALRSPLESAVATWIAPVAQRLVVRNADGGLDVWLVGAGPFDAAIEAVRKAASARTAYDGGVRARGWTWLEPDKSYLVETSVGDDMVRLRLTRHGRGALVELQQTGTASEAPRWVPPYRPQPVLLLHGGALR
ncbi:MAG: hypothetical protein FJ100_22085 [Deltaproteobacteria bacterium]|nr:hypothetical protein [Deltaproteobacteria bacterium]